MANFSALEVFLANAYLPVFGNNVLLAGLFVSLSLLIMLSFWGAGLEATIAIMAALVILLVSTTNVLPLNVGFIVILVLLIPLYWALRGFISR